MEIENTSIYRPDIGTLAHPHDSHLPEIMMKSCLLAGVASVAAFSSTPGGISLDPDVTVTAESQNCDGR
eukprot:scaffold3078_cov90-Isochrysis_galbana.AAC.5